MTLPTPQATPAPAPPATPQVLTADVCAVNQANYAAAVATRDELQSQLGSLQSSRRSIANRLREGGMAAGPDKNGLETQIAELDKQITGMFVKIGEADAAVAKATAVPCAVPPPPPPRPRDGPPEEVFVLGGMFIFFVMFPMAIAASRRIWRRAGQIMKMPPELTDRITRLEQSVDSVAIEIERIGEGQRFVTNLFIEGGAPMLNPGPMNTLEIKQREKAEAEQRR